MIVSCRDCGVRSHADGSVVRVCNVCRSQRVSPVSADDRYDAAVDATVDADDVDAALRRLADEAESYSRKDAA